MHKSPTIVSIPGTSNPDHMRENIGAASVKLSPHLMAKVDALVNERTVTGGRYPDAMQATVDTEDYA
jgi:aryl-alcohol dehydrogenase-like predicted oxidoreductase